jgi:hydrogenase maturation protease
MRTLVVGIGNIVHSDDGAGVYAARMLQADARLPADVTVIEGGTLGLELLPYLQDADRVLLLDGIDVSEAPGTVVCLRGDGVHGMKGNWSVHQLGVADLLAALRLIRDDQPEVVILGVQPGSTEWGTELSPQVSAAMPELLEAAIGELRAWEERGTTEADSRGLPSLLCAR